MMSVTGQRGGEATVCEVTEQSPRARTARRDEERCGG